MATKGEKKALIFLGVVLLLGSGARLYASVRGSKLSEQPALDRQIRTVDSLKEERKLGKKKPKKGKSKRTKKPPADSLVGYQPVSTVPATPAGPVDMDTAPEAALERLRGIGPKLAATIVADRQKSGPFHTLEGLQRVRGIGPALAEKLRPYVTFSGRR